MTCATGTQIYTYPGYDDFAGWPVQRDTHDVGVVILDQPIAVSEYGQLAEPNTLDALYTARGTQDAIFTVAAMGSPTKALSPSSHSGSGSWPRRRW